MSIWTSLQRFSGEAQRVEKDGTVCERQNMCKQIIAALVCMVYNIKKSYEIHCYIFTSPIGSIGLTTRAEKRRTYLADQYVLY